MKCPIFSAADIVGKKWTIVIVQEVGLNGEKGFNAIFKRMHKISPKLLSQRLKELESHNIISKRIHTNTVPVRTSYTLTKKGKDLQNVIDQLRAWHTKYEKLDECKGECVSCPLY